jgi:hypothetical protein
LLAARQDLSMKNDQIHELLLQSLEHERGGVQVYTSALQCVLNDGLEEEWREYLAQTRTHVSTLEALCKKMDLDPEQETPGRAVVRHLGGALVKAMDMARSAGNPAAAELVACECVVLAETKDHLDWELLGKVGDHLKGPRAEAITAAYEEIEEQEDEHLYHTKGWCRELWLKSLGLTAILPPPEEQKHVKSAIGAARAEQAAEKSR